MSEPDFNRIREEFPITRDYVFLNTAAVAPISRRVGSAIRRYVDEAERQGPVGTHWYRDIERVRGRAGSLIQADRDEIAFVKNTSEGLCFVANGLTWSPGDNVVTTGVEYPANVYPWMALRDRGVELRVAREQDGRIPLASLVGLMDGRTRLVAISAVQYASGFRTDLVALGRACRQRGVFFCVDGIQALGVHPVDVREMRIDFLSADGHKWLCGPEGAGIFYCRRELLPEVTPIEPGWMCMVNADDYGNYQFEFRPDARRFEPGSFNVPGVLGLGAAIDLVLEIGVEAIHERVLGLADRLVEGLRSKHWRVISSRDRSEASAIVAFVSEKHDPQALADRLANEHKIVIACREGRLRASPHFYNNERDIDALLDRLPSG